MRFAKRFWTIAVSLAGVVALYVAAEPFGLVWVFWAVIIASGILAGVTVVGPALLESLNRLRNYDRLLATAGQAQAANLESEARNQRLQDQLNQAREQSYLEGQKSVIGGLLALQPTRLPKLTGVNLIDGEIVLIAAWRSGDAQVGARYRLEVKTTGTVRGVLEVRDVDIENKRMTLFVCSDTSSRFWQYVRETAEVNSAPPQDVELLPEIIAELDAIDWLVEATARAAQPSTISAEA